MLPPFRPSAQPLRQPGGLEVLPVRAPSSAIRKPGPVALRPWVSQVCPFVGWEGAYTRSAHRIIQPWKRVVAHTATTWKGNEVSTCKRVGSSRFGPLPPGA